MSFHKKVLLFLIVALVLLVVFLGGLSIIFKNTAQAPAAPAFQGPTSLPHTNGPSGPPPSSY